MNRISVVLLLLTATGCLGAEPEWTGWLGPNRDGWVADIQPPERWPDELTKRWQVKVGTGYGTPLVVGNRVFQHARQGDDEVVWCVDLDSGDVKWHKSYIVPFKMGGGGERHGKGPKGCPVYADGRVFTMSITGVLSAWNADSGDLLWRSEFGSRFKKSHPYWGSSTSPIVDGDRVIAHYGTDDDGALVALDVETGNEVWSHGKDGPDYSSPLLADLGGVRQLIEWNQRVLTGVESKSGKFLWEYPFPHVGTDQNMPTPTFYNGTILLGAENRGIQSLQPVLQNGEWTVKRNWHHNEVALDMSSAVINDGLFYGFSHYDTGRIFCLDPETGKVLWKGPPRTGQNVTFLAMPGHVIALINNGKLRVIKAGGDAYQETASYQVSDQQTWAAPVMLSNGLLTKDHDTLVRWNFSP